MNMLKKIVVEETSAAVNGLVIGRIVRITAEDVALVDFPGNQAGPLEAGITADPPSICEGSWPPVLLAFECGDPTRPVIVGFVRRKFFTPKRIIEAGQELSLRC